MKYSGGKVFHGDFQTKCIARIGAINSFTLEVLHTDEAHAGPGMPSDKQQLAWDFTALPLRLPSEQKPGPVLRFWNCPMELIMLQESRGEREKGAREGGKPEENPALPTIHDLRSLPASKGMSMCSPLWALIFKEG